MKVRDSGMSEETMWSKFFDPKMKIGIILETKELEKAWNAFRFAVTAKKTGREVKVF